MGQEGVMERAAIILFLLLLPRGEGRSCGSSPSQLELKKDERVFISYWTDQIYEETPAAPVTSSPLQDVLYNDVDSSQYSDSSEENASQEQDDTTDSHRVDTTPRLISDRVVDPTESIKSEQDEREEDLEDIGFKNSGGDLVKAVSIQRPEIIDKTEASSVESVVDVEGRTEESVPEIEAKTEEIAPEIDEKQEASTLGTEERTEDIFPEIEAKTEEPLLSIEAKTDEIVPEIESKTDEIVPEIESKTDEIVPEIEAKTEEHVAEIEAKTDQTDIVIESRTEPSVTEIQENTEQNDIEIEVRGESGVTESDGRTEENVDIEGRTEESIQIEGRAEEITVKPDAKTEEDTKQIEVKSDESSTGSYDQHLTVTLTAEDDIPVASDVKERSGITTTLLPDEYAQESVTMEGRSELVGVGQEEEDEKDSGTTESSDIESTTGRPEYFASEEKIVSRRHQENNIDNDSTMERDLLDMELHTLSNNEDLTTESRTDAAVDLGDRERSDIDTESVSTTEVSDTLPSTIVYEVRGRTGLIATTPPASEEETSDPEVIFKDDASYESTQSTISLENTRNLDETAATDTPIADAATNSIGTNTEAAELTSEAPVSINEASSSRPEMLPVAADLHSHHQVQPVEHKSGSSEQVVYSGDLLGGIYRIVESLVNPAQSSTGPKIFQPVDYSSLEPSSRRPLRSDGTGYWIRRPVDDDLYTPEFAPYSSRPTDMLRHEEDSIKPVVARKPHAVARGALKYDSGLLDVPRPQQLAMVQEESSASRTSQLLNRPEYVFSPLNQKQLPPLQNYDQVPQYLPFPAMTPNPPQPVTTQSGEFDPVESLKRGDYHFHRFLNAQSYPVRYAFFGDARPRYIRQLKIEDEINCEWIVKTEPGLYLLATFHNLSAPYTVDCHGAYIEVERESNGFEARWCGNRVAQVQGSNRPHVIFARSEIRITVYDDGQEHNDMPTGFSAEVEVVDLSDARQYDSFRRSHAYSNLRYLTG